MTLTDYREIMQATADYLWPQRSRPQCPRPQRRVVPQKLSAATPSFMFKGMYLIPLAPRYTIGKIQAATAAYYGLPFFEMMSARRGRAVARPRQVAMYLARHLTPRSLPEIADRFGGRDHTTVMHGIAQITRLRQLDAELDADVCEIVRGLGA